MENTQVKELEQEMTGVETAEEKEVNQLAESVLAQRKAVKLLNDLYSNMVTRDQSMLMAKYQLPQFVSVLSEDACSHVDEIVAEFEGKTGEDVKAMDGKALKERMIELLGAKENDLIFNMTEEGVKEALSTIVDASKAMEEVDAAVAELNVEIDKIRKELAEILGAEDVPSLIKKNLEMMIASEDPAIKPEMKKKASLQLTAIEESMTLTGIKDLYTHISPANALKDFRDDQKRTQVVKQYEEAMKMMKLKSSIMSLTDFESRFLPEEYHDRNNLFVFIVMRYVAAKQFTSDRDTIGMLVMSLTSIMCTFYTETVSEAVKEKFLTTVKEILDLFK